MQRRFEQIFEKEANIFGGGVPVGGRRKKKRASKKSGYGIALSGRRGSGPKGKAAAARNPWIAHVKAVVDRTGMTYGEALRDPRTSASYRR
jgi:hypothetical protein